MTIIEQHTAPAAPADDVEAAAWIAERLRTKTVEQVIDIGERTGWWSPDLVEAVFDGRLGELERDLTARGVVAASEPAPLVAGDLVDPPVVSAPVTPGTSAPEPAEAPRGEPIPIGPSSDIEFLAPTGSYVAVLQARQLGVDHSYQRPLDQPRVRRMAAAWDPRMVGTIDVSDRGEGAGPIRYAVINGQHRAAAAAEASPDGADVWLACTVHEGLTVAEEAALMHEMDRATKKLTGFDQWRARRAAGDVAVLEVESVAAIHGLRVGPEPTDGVLRSYGAAEKLLKLGGRDLLDATLAVLSAAYGTAASAYQAPLVTGVGQVLHRNPGLDVDRLRVALVKTRPEQLRASATALRDFQGGPLHELMAMAIVTAYNRTSGDGPRIRDGR